LWQKNNEFYKGGSPDDVPLDKGGSPLDTKGGRQNDKGGSPGSFKEEPMNNITLNKNPSSELSSQVNKIMELFSNINPSLNWGNKTTRGAAEWLIKKYTAIGALSMTQAVIEVQGKPYAPVATTPYQMKEKLAQFKIYFDQQKNNKSNFVQL
jgi:hypothetical protein